MGQSNFFYSRKLVLFSLLGALLLKASLPLGIIWKNDTSKKVYHFPPMCLNLSKVRNPYSGDIIYVPCGHCPACLQSKANQRANRIRNNSSSETIPLFFHLTYAPAYVPYIIKDYLKIGDSNVTPVWRDHKVTSYYNRHVGDTLSFSSLEVDNKPIDYYYNPFLLEKEYDDLKLLNDSHYNTPYNRVGVLYYKDIQDFFKRLRSNLKRNYEYKNLISSDDCLSYFVTGEYGEDGARPHWHVILYVPKFNLFTRKNGQSVLERWKQLVSQTWQFAFRDRTERRFEIAVDAAKYAACYVNSSSVVSTFLKRSSYRPVWHYSHGFGKEVPAFTLSNLLKKIQDNDVRYFVEYLDKRKTAQRKLVSFPQYFTNRYFPNFKGRFRLTSNELVYLLRDPYKLDKFQYKLGLSHYDVMRIVPKLENAYWRFNKESGLNRFDYAYYYDRFIRLSSSLLFRLQYETIKQPIDNFHVYYNLLDYDVNKISSFSSLRSHLKCKDFRKYVSPLYENPLLVSKDYSLTQQFNDFIKQKKINSVVYG